MNRNSLIKLKDRFIAEEINDEKSKKTIEHYKHVVDMFVGYLKNENVTKSDVIEFKQWMQERYKPKTTSNYIVVINKFLKYSSIVNAGYPFKIARTGEYAKLANMGEIEDLTIKNIKIQNRSSLKEMLDPIDLKRLMHWAKKIRKNGYVFDYESHSFYRCKSRRAKGIHI